MLTGRNRAVGDNLSSLKTQRFTEAGTILKGDDGFTLVHATLPASGTYALTAPNAAECGAGHMLKVKAAAQADGSPGTVTILGLTFAVLAEKAVWLSDGEAWCLINETIA